MRAFYNCDGITEIEIPEAVTSIGSYAFYDCGSLTKIEIPAGVDSIGEYTFYNCVSFTDVTIPDGVTSIGNYAFAYCATVTDIKLPSALKTIGSYAFSGWSALADVELPDGLLSIGSYAFKDCSLIKTLVVPDSVTSIGNGAFKGWSALEEITVPFIGEDIGGSSTSSDVFGYIFEYSDSYVSGATTQHFMAPPTSYSITYYGYYSIPSTLTKVTITKETIVPYGAFYNCSKLTEINLPETITDIRTNAFYNCGPYNNAENWENDILYIGSTLAYVKTKPAGELSIREGTTTIADDAFASSISLNKVSFPDSVKYIGESAFSGCTGLTEVLLGSGVEEIKDNAFYNCDYIQHVKYRGSEVEWDEIVIGINNEDLTEAERKMNGIFITVIDQDGNKVNEIETTARVTFDGSIVPEKAEHTYKLYADAEMTVPFDETQILLADTIVYVKYTINQYTYTFYDGDGNIFVQVTADYGTAVPKPVAEPTKTNTAQYTYFFTGWDGFVNGTILTEDISFAPTFDSVLNKYKYQFVGEDGTVYAEKAADYGTVIIKPDVVVEKESDVQYVYTFAGWKGYTDGMILESDVVFVADYTTETKRYKYEFLNSDGSVAKMLAAEYGTVIVPPAANPADEDPYTFDYWNGYEEGMVLVGDIQFTPVFKYKTYTITVAGNDATEISVVYDSNYTLVPVSSEGYLFAGYYTEPDGKGEKLTDENGCSLSKYDFARNITAYPYFEEDKYINKIVVSGREEITVGETDLNYVVEFGTDKDVQYAIITLKYPNTLQMNSYKSKDFVDVSIQSEYEIDGYTVVEFLCFYSFEGLNMPKNTILEAVDLSFALVDDSERSLKIEATADSLLSGEADYEFVEFVPAEITVVDKLAEEISITGSDSIDKPAQYTATVSPSHTSNKGVVWSVDDEAIATISETGLLTPIKAGTVIITATAQDGSGVYATKEVVITNAYAVINSLASNTGLWDKAFDSYEFEYTIIVPTDVESITLTPEYRLGIVKINNTAVASGRSRNISLNEGVNEITLDRTNVSGAENTQYVITVLRSDDVIIASLDSEAISIYLNSNEALEGKKLIVAAYSENGELIGMESRTVLENPDYTFDFVTGAKTYKVMLWDKIYNIEPYCESVKLEVK